MKPVRIILAALVGGAVAFGWGFLSHTVLQLGQMGVRNLPQEATLVPALQGALTDRAVYMFPPMATKDATGAMLKGEAAKAAADEWMKKYEAGPRGILVYDPTGEPAMSLKMLGTEFASSALAALLAAIVMSWSCCNFLGRAAIALMLGVFAWASIELSHWNWHRFPTEYTLAQLADQGIGWLLAGVSMAGIVGGQAPCEAPEPAAAG